MTDDLRSEANIRHFASRSQQPKVLAAGPTSASAGVAPTPTNVFIVFDQGFGSVADQIDDTKFKYVGTNPQLSYFNKSNSRKTKQEVMKEGFSW